MKYFIILAALFFATSAHALQVVNCSDKAETISVDYYGETKQVILKPADRKRFYGRARSVSLGEQVITLLHHDNEYCIRDGRLSLQRRNRNNKRNR